MLTLNQYNHNVENNIEDQDQLDVPSQSSGFKLAEYPTKRATKTAKVTEFR